MTRQLKTILRPNQNKSRQLRHKSQSSKWKFEFTGPNISKEKPEKITVRTKFYWCWAGGPVIIVRTD